MQVVRSCFLVRRTGLEGPEVLLQECRRCFRHHMSTEAFSHAVGARTSVFSQPFDFVLGLRRPRIQFGPAPRLSVMLHPIADIFCGNRRNYIHRLDGERYDMRTWSARYLMDPLRRAAFQYHCGKRAKHDVLGFGSVSRDESERMTLKRDNAGDQLCLRMSMHMLPRSLMFMWYILRGESGKDLLQKERLTES